MKKKLFVLLILVVMIICSACTLASCGEIKAPSDKGGIETPIEPENPNKPEEGGQGGFSGNLPSNPTREDSYNAN